MEKHNSSQSRFHLWMPNIFEYKGGIQVYSAFFLQALQYLDPTAQYNVFLKQDTDAARPTAKLEYLSHTRFSFSGNWPWLIRTQMFASQLLFQGLLLHPTLVFVQHLHFASVAYMLKHLTNVPYWIVVYGLEAWNVKNPLLQKALHSADHILAISDYTRRRLVQEQQISPNKISLLPNPIDFNRFSIQPKPAYLLERYQLRPEQPVILTVARLAETERYKGYDQILAALTEIRQTIPDIHYVIVGKGPDQARIEQLILQRDLQGHVTLTGFVPDSELSDHYNLCDLFAMPSKREGFGFVYLEALACGKPVIGGNQDGAVDALCQGKLGILVDPDNIAEIAQTIVQILQRRYEHPLLYQPERLRQAVIENFGFERFTQTLAGYLSTQLGQSDECNAHHPFSHS
jgi:glycosyltransferase involved in cell wall biosynthesis